MRPNVYAVTLAVRRYEPDAYGFRVSLLDEERRVVLSAYTAMDAADQCRIVAAARDENIVVLAVEPNTIETQSDETFA